MVPFVGAVVSRVIAADAGLALTLPFASFHHACTVFRPSPFDRVKGFDVATVV